MSAISISPIDQGYQLKALGSPFIFTLDPQARDQGLCHAHIDCCSLNLSCEEVQRQTYFSTRDIADLQAAYQEKKEQQLSGKSVVVLDISSGSRLGYLSPTIPAMENLLFDYFQDPTNKENARSFKSPSMRAATELLEQEGSFAIVAFEGSLKRDLLLYGGFSKATQAQLQNDSLLFCQITEVFINAMKLGHQGKSLSGHIFSSATYFKTVDGTPFQPCLHSYTLYPPLYAQVYHPEGHIPKEWKKIFYVEGMSRPTSQITTLCVKEKN
jgi:hypothetical protein